MTGGYPYTETSLSTRDGAAFDTTSVPSLPAEEFGHCLASVDNRTLVAVGGVVADPKAVFRFAHGVETFWTPMPGMLEARDSAGCGVVSEPHSGRMYLVAAGGFGTDYLDSTEIFDLTELTWKEGKGSVVLFLQQSDSVIIHQGPLLPRPVGYMGKVRLLLLPALITSLSQFQLEKLLLAA